MSPLLDQAASRLRDRLGPALAASEEGLVATPTNSEALLDTLAIASEVGLRTLVVGKGLRLDWGNPVETDLTLSTAGLTQVQEYAPDDMVVTAEAGMTLQDLNALLATRYQILPLEVPHPERTTLGGLVAAAPLSLARPGYGDVKDWVIGLSVATPTGQLVRAGGKVVKNVAGYDLCKLYAGSLGTLGAIATVTFRVRPRWEATALVAATFSGPGAEAALEAVQTTHLAAVVNAVQVTGEAARFVLGFDGPPETVEWQIQEARHLFEGLGGEQLQTLRDEAALPARSELAQGMHGPHSGFGVRCSLLPSDVLACYRTARSSAQALGFELTGFSLAPHGSLWIQGDAPAAERTRWLEEVRAIALSQGGHVTIEARAGWPAEVDSFMLDKTTRTLMRRIQAGLDPSGLMAPGRFRLEGGAHGAP